MNFDSIIRASKKVQHKVTRVELKFETHDRNF